jgi:hypothetical protein
MTTVLRPAPYVTSHLPKLIGPVVIALALSAMAAPSLAQPLAPGAANYTVPAQRIETGAAPIIDGDLSDAAWASAAVIDQLVQRQPNVGDPASEQTIIRVLYDENNLYFGIYAYDENPEDIAVRAMSRDGNMFSADNIFIKLDPGQTRRNGYSFQVSSAGGRRDGLLQNNSDALYEWNTIWDAKVQIVEDGWIAEIVIPFRSLSYDQNQTDWGFDIGRSIRHKNETVMWSGYLPTLSGADLTRAGTITGVTEIAQGLGLDVQVYSTARLRHIAPGTEGTDLSGTGGGNIFYKITPALTGTLTFNPDFSDSPLDARQVNTTRFSLFFDETRDFFLQDAAAFEFGGFNFLNNGNNARPFFSRNIGLVSGRPVSIIGGGKLSGEVAGFGIGALSVVTADQGTAPQQILSVARVTRPVLGESSIGMIVTNGDPTGASENTVLGADFQYRNSNFLGDQVVQTDFFYERSFSNTFGDDDSFGMALTLPNEPWGGRLTFKQVGEDFRPALGFANRRGIRRYEGRLINRYRYRDRFIRQAIFAAEGEYITGLDNRPQNFESDLSIEIETYANDRAWVDLRNYYERVPELFTLPRDVPVSLGDYNWTNFGFRFQTSGARSVQFRVDAECCSFYNGDSFQIEAGINWRPNRYFEFQPGYEATYISLPSGSVDIHILTLDSVLNFTPDMQLAIEVQWDNTSQAFAFSGRYIWEYSPGNELFIGLGQTAILPTLSPSRFEPQTTLLSIRLGRTFQF